jgi:hypothetical protein
MSLRAEWMTAAGLRVLPALTPERPCRRDSASGVGAPSEGGAAGPRSRTCCAVLNLLLGRGQQATGSPAPHELHKVPAMAADGVCLARPPG